MIKWARMLRTCLLSSLAVAGSLTQAEEFTPIVGFDEQLFPSFIVCTATQKTEPPEEEADPSGPVTLGDHGGQIGIAVQSPRKDTPITVTVTCDEVMEPSVFTGTLASKGKEYQVFPRIKYKFTRLTEVVQATPVAMTFKVKIGTSMTEQTLTVMLRPVNDCPFLIQDGENWINTSYTFAAYVNEQHPFIDKLLREALDIGIVTSFSGYQQGPDEVVRQVYAVWDALVTRDVRYSSITATSVNAKSVASQHVRLIEDTLNNSQANCVDGSVLIASALRKIGIEPFLVLVPGHCYVGFYADEEKTQIMALETTLLGSTYEEDEEFDTCEVIEDAVDEDSRFDASWPSFASAIVTGSNSFEEVRDKFDDENESQYMLIDISAARDNGIVPIAFRGKEKFVPNGLNESRTDSDEEE